MSNHDPLDELFGPQEDPRVAAALRAIGERLLEAPDEVTARRHRRAIAAARPVGARQVVERSLVAGVTATAAAMALAAGGLLPDPAQEVVADLASLVGLDLPRPTPGEGDVDETPASSEERDAPDTGDGPPSDLPGTPGPAVATPDTPGPAVPTPDTPGPDVPPPDTPGPDVPPPETPPPGEQGGAEQGGADDHADEREDAPMLPGDAPGRSEDAGRSRVGPGRPTEAPETIAGQRGRSGEAPGRPDDAPGRSGDAPARTGDTAAGGDPPGRAADRPPAPQPAQQPERPERPGVDAVGPPGLLPDLPALPEPLPGPDRALDAHDVGDPPPRGGPRR